MGLDFIEKYCFDTDGRMFYEVTETGTPVRKRRYVFLKHLQPLPWPNMLWHPETKVMQKKQSNYSNKFSITKTHLGL